MIKPEFCQRAGSEILRDYISPGAKPFYPRQVLRIPEICHN